MTDEADPVTDDFDEEWSALLADPALWAEPPPDLADRVVAAVSAERLIVAPPRRTRWYVPLMTAAAAAAAVLAAVVFVGRGSEGTEVTMAATDLFPEARGRAEVKAFDSGVRIILDATGLPRRDGGKYYQAWLKGESGLVPIGTFHDGDEVVLWAGVSIEDFPTITVTEEEVGDQQSSGRRVLVGTIGG